MSERSGSDEQQRMKGRADEQVWEEKKEGSVSELY